MHYFIDHSKITSETKAYGPLAADPTKKYNVTTQFTLDGVTKAFACQSSLMLVAQAPDAALVNVILKPLAGLDIPFGKVKYYIYRGIQKSSFFSGDEITPLDTSNSEFVRDLWLSYTLLQLIQPEAEPPTPDSLGYIDFLDTMDVELLFSALGSPEVAKNRVAEGVWIGDFNNACGFEIITENDNYEIDLGYVRKAEQVFDITSLPSGTSEEKFILKSEKEKILNYIDPAAFWGMHYEKGTTIFDDTTDSDTRFLQKEDIYDELLAAYSTKNTVYLDLRSEYGYSYNFYENYADSGAGGSNIKFKTDGANPYINNIYGSNWPIFSDGGGNIEFNSYSSFFIQLRVNDNLKPLLFFEDKKLIPAAKRPCVLDDTELLDGASTDWTKDIEFRFPNVNDGGMVVFISTYLKAQYFRQEYNPASPNTVIKKEAMMDKGLRMQNFPLLLELHKNTLDKKAFVSGMNFGFVSESGMFYDNEPGNDNAVVYLKSIFPYKSSREFYPKLSVSTESFKTLNPSPAFPKEILFSKWQVAEDATTTIDIIDIAGFNKNSSAKSKEEMFFLGLKQAEYDLLNPDASDAANPISAISKTHTKLIVLEEVPDQKDFNTQIPFKKYSLKVLGLNKSGTSEIAAPATPIFVFGIGSSILCSRDFAAAIDLPYEFPEPGTMKEYDFAGRISYDPNDPVVTALFPSGDKKVKDMHTVNHPVLGDRLASFSVTSSLIGEVHFPTDADGSTILSSRRLEYPLVVVVHGNGHRYSDYRKVCEHLALNGFIAASISVLVNSGVNKFPLSPVTVDGNGDFFIFRGSDTTYLYCNNPAGSGDFAFEKVTVVKVETDLTAPGSPPVENKYLLPWVKGTDFKINTDGLGQPAEIELNFTIGRQGMNPVGRSRLLYPHLKILEALFPAQIEDNIGLIGHSRGGQAVARIPQEIGEAQYDAPAGLRSIKSIISLAPTDAEGWGQEDIDEDVPYFVLYGSRDGDVSGIQKAGFSLWDRAKGLKSMAFIYGATHNGFITDDHDWTMWQKDAHSEFSKSVLTPLSTQKVIALSYFNAFFRMTLRNESKWKSLFTGEIASRLISSSENKGVYFQYTDTTFTSGAPKRKTVDDFETNNSITQSSSGGAVTVLGTIGITEGVFRKWLSYTATGSSSDTSIDSYSPHDTKGILVKWNANDKLTFQLPSPDMTGFTILSFRIAKGVKTPSNLSELKISLNNIHSVKVSDYFKIPDPDLRPNVGLDYGGSAGDEWNDKLNTKSAMITIRIPLEPFLNNGVVITNISSLSFIFPTVGTGEADIDSIEFTN